MWPIKYKGSCTTDVKVDLTQGVILKAGRRKDSEIFDFTNFEKNGESFQNEFARNRSVKSWVNIATVAKDGIRNPRRAFQPFNKGDAELEEVMIMDSDGKSGDPITRPDGAASQDASRKAVESEKPVILEDALKPLDNKPKKKKKAKTKESDSEIDLW